MSRLQSKRTTGKRKSRGRCVEVLSGSPEETHRLGVELARSMKIPGVLLLRGTLGTGKTTLARGVAEGLGLCDGSEVNSPSFTLVNIYRARCPIYHVDLYRLSGERDLRSIGLDDFMDQDGVTVVEWSERLKRRPESAIDVELEDAGDDRRRIRIHYPLCPPGAGRISRSGRKSGRKQPRTVRKVRTAERNWQP